MTENYLKTLSLYKELVACYNNIPLDQMEKEVKNDIYKIMKINEDISIPTTCNLYKCKELLSQLKLEIIHFSSNDPMIPVHKKNLEELILSRDILEKGVIISLRDKDVKSFNIYFNQLCVYYFDYKNALPLSKRQNGITGVYLLYLLSSNLIADFHMLLELIDLSDLQDPYIKYVLKLEQNVMDGYFHFVLTKKEQMPLYLYSLFIDKFHDMIRCKLADCVLASSTSISVTHACELLHFDNSNQLHEFINSYNEMKIIQGEQDSLWKVKDGIIVYKNQVVTTPELPTLEMFNNAIGYATELERVI